MRIHTDTVTGRDVREFTRDLEGVYAEVTEHGSRSRDHALEVKLTGNSSRHPNSGPNYRAGDEHAATWDEWGIVLGRIFEADPSATCWAYSSLDHFDWVTGARFTGSDALEHGNQCMQHRWDYSGASCMGAYSVSECTRCGAIQRRGDWARVFAA